MMSNNMGRLGACARNVDYRCIGRRLWVPLVEVVFDQCRISEFRLPIADRQELGAKAKS
jgi:hypothetical protein